MEYQSDISKRIVFKQRPLIWSIDYLLPDQILETFIIRFPCFQTYTILSSRNWQNVPEVLGTFLAYHESKPAGKISSSIYILPQFTKGYIFCKLLHIQRNVNWRLGRWYVTFPFVYFSTGVVVHDLKPLQKVFKTHETNVPRKDSKEVLLVTLFRSVSKFFKSIETWNIVEKSGRPSKILVYNRNGSHYFNWWPIWCICRSETDLQTSRGFIQSIFKMDSYPPE